MTYLSHSSPVSIYTSMRFKERTQGLFQRPAMPLPAFCTCNSEVFILWRCLIFSSFIVQVETWELFPDFSPGNTTGWHQRPHSPQWIKGFMIKKECKLMDIPMAPWALFNEGWSWVRPAMLCSSVFSLPWRGCLSPGVSFSPRWIDLLPFFTGLLGTCFVMPDVSNCPWLQLK